MFSAHSGSASYSGEDAFSKKKLRRNTNTFYFLFKKVFAVIKHGGSVHSGTYATGEKITAGVSNVQLGAKTGP